MIASTNPTNGEVVARFDAYADARIDKALDQADAAQRAWRKRPLRERVALLTAVAALLRDRKSRYAAVITLEMGKPLAEAEAEVEKCALNCVYYAENAERFVGDEAALLVNGNSSKVVFDPLGLVLAVMPWNYPLWQVMRFAAPAVAAGNGVVLKHASNVPQCALLLEEVFRDAGAPAGLFVTLLVESARVKSLIEDPRIAAVTLTGSTPVGKRVAAQAGAVLKKQVLELGGSDPFIVLADADIEAAARVAVKARFQNAGQSCICAKRFIVEDSVADRFVEAMHAHVTALKVGDPTLRTTDMGPMARPDLRAELHDQVQRTLAQGGTLLAGGRLPDGAGAFYAPTLIDHVAPAMAIGAEETFGPVAAVLRVKDPAAAIALANATEYGLGAALWTSDLQRAERLLREIDAGAVFVNGLVASDPRLPFGGLKQSGYGRELGSYGIREFTNIKTVWVAAAR
jgi:succinate-semialdehyde dehydrogenase/glutarate-semialdehyde dehydrogenase